MASTEEKTEETLGYFERPKICARFKYGSHKESTLLEFEGVDQCNGSMLIEALRGIGTTSTVVGAHLIGTLKLQCVAVFVSPSLPAMTSVHKFMPTSAIRIYGNKEMCVAISDYALHSTDRCDIVWQICQSVMEFAQRHKCKHIISVDGFPVTGGVQQQIESMAKQHMKQQQKLQNHSAAEDDDEDKEKEKETEPAADPFAVAHYLSTDKSIAEKLKQSGHEGIKTMQIMGATGAMMQMAFCGAFYGDAEEDNQADVPFSALLAPDPVSIPDRRGALLAIRLLREVWGLHEIDVESLQQDAARLQEKVQQTVSEIATQMQAQRRIQMQAQRPPQHMYV
mmetsp:Transcript_15725/g.24929  ORF Transcript_15725/g.24929 Transcript_15725/m.24929 type:complete len:338 (+) Transcript_15725:47-1060(+)